MSVIKRVGSKIRLFKGKAEAAKPKSAFGGFRKRTITTRELVGSSLAMVPSIGTIYKVWVKHEIDPGFREELMLAVSELNHCRYCTWAHHEWAHMVGVSDDELAHVEQMDPTGFDRRKWLAISYVRALVTAKFERVDKDLVREMKAKYTPMEIKEIEIVARIMDIGNRAANTWDALLSRLRGGPATDTHIFDELVMSGAFLATAPIVLIFLAQSSNRPLMEMLRSVIDLIKVPETKPAKPAAKPAA
jgi:AhpD family alkylhydroperoxidase